MISNYMPGEASAFFTLKGSPATPRESGWYCHKGHGSEHTGLGSNPDLPPARKSGAYFLPVEWGTSPWLKGWLERLNEIVHRKHLTPSQHRLSRLIKKSQEVLSWVLSLLDAVSSHVYRSFNMHKSPNRGQASFLQPTHHTQQRAGRREAQEAKIKYL